MSNELSSPVSGSFGRWTKIAASITAISLCASLVVLATYLWDDHPGVLILSQFLFSVAAIVTVLWGASWALRYIWSGNKDIGWH
tara:strand:- start:461 stop:712 length:252 start_codon:yes stop_codon:yes gene_type:complete